MGADMDDPRVTDCGLWGWRPSFLKVFNTPTSYLILYSLSCLACAVSLGMNQFLLPTLQQLFNMTSTQMGLILISNDISGLIVAFVFGHFASKGKIRWLFFGVIVNLIANMMQSGTQLFVKLPDPRTLSSTNSSGGDDTLCMLDSEDDESHVSPIGDAMFYAAQNNKLFWVLFVAGILQGVGTPHQVCGMTYLDEVMTKKRLGPSIAITTMIALFGFPLSFIFGAYLLTQYVTLGQPPPGVTPGSTHWVGAWWMGYLAPAVLLVISGIPLILFPKQMPAAKVVLQEKIDNGEASDKEKDSELNRPFTELIKDMIPTVTRLLKNKALLFLLAGEALNNVYLSSLPYDTKILSLLFKISVPETGIMLGILRTMVGVIGLGAGGAYLGRFSPSGKTCMLLVAVTQLIALPGPLMTLLHCKPDDVAGISVPYPASSSTMDFNKGSRNLTNTCNSDCGCSTRFYEPVCDLQSHVTYFSPCHAGCNSSYTNESESRKMYTNCDCSNTDLVAGACPAEDSCSMKKWIVFIIQQLILGIIHISNYPAMGVAYLRVVPEIDRSAAQGMKQFFTRAFGFVLGPIIFGAIIDSYCVVWRGGGSCWLYDLHSMIVTFSMGQLGFRALGTLCMFIAWRLYPEKTAHAYSQVDDSAQL